MWNRATRGLCRNSELNSLSQIASRSHSPLVQAETYPDDSLLSCISSCYLWHRVVQSDDFFHTLLRFELENSAQNELGKGHVSAFLWFFSEMGCVPRTRTCRLGPSWFPVNKNEIIRCIWLGVFLELLKNFRENWCHCRLILYVLFGKDPGAIFKSLNDLFLLNKRPIAFSASWSYLPQSNKKHEFNDLITFALVWKIFKWNYEHHLYGHTSIPMVNGCTFQSTSNDFVELQSSRWSWNVKMLFRTWKLKPNEEKIIIKSTKACLFYQKYFCKQKQFFVKSNGFGWKNSRF